MIIKKIKIMLCATLCFFATMSINTLAETQKSEKDSTIDEKIEIEPRIYTTDVEQACDGIYYNGGFERFENCTYKKITYWNGFNQFGHKGNDISTRSDREYGIRRYRYTFTYETY